MVLEHEPLPYAEFLREAATGFAVKSLVLATAAVFLTFLVLGARYGPAAAVRKIGEGLASAGRDFLRFSPRRIAALAKLALREALRRKVLVAFAIFIGILLFAGWFQVQGNSEPAKIYLDIVLKWTNYLVLLLAMFLGTMSLPADFKNRTIYTLMTKPVHPGEVVLGRIIGFSAIGTILLVAMGASSYVFVTRVFRHTHELKEENLKKVGGAAARAGTIVKVGQTSDAQGQYPHHHDVELDADGNGWTSFNLGHRHAVTAQREGEKVTYEVGPPEELLVARVPVYGELRFRDRTGQDKPRGISVGAEWTYRSFVDGAAVPLAAAIWTFSGVDAAKFSDGLPLEFTIRSFRTHKGDVERGLRGQFFLRNPKTQRQSQSIIFRVKDNVLDSYVFPRALLDSNGKSIDLFEDLTAGGQIEIWLQCLDSQQYLGVAKADVYLRAEDASFELNFVKGFAGIWVSMVLLTAFGVVCSTFLSAPVALLAAAFLMLMGFLTQPVVHLADSVLLGREGVKSGDYIPGGGPLEATIRWVRRDNSNRPLEGPGVGIALEIDRVILRVLRALATTIPDYSQFSNRQYVIDGFNVPHDVILTQLTQLVGFLVVTYVSGYFFLENSRDGAMNEQRAFYNKLIYLGIVVVLLIPLYLLSEPGSIDAQGNFHGGVLATKRNELGLNQANLGEVDPVSEGYKLVTLGLRPLAVLILWEDSHYYQKVEDWANYEVTLNQMIRLQANFVTVWESQSHNLAFNISAELDDWRDKYVYVVKGLKFLISGTRYNQHSSLLPAQVGWFVTQKIGKSDERVLFRRKFSGDYSLHEYLDQFIDMSQTRRDSWLVGKAWYLKAMEAAKNGAPIRREADIIFYSHAPLAQIYYADTLEDEGHFDAVTRAAWQQSAKDWQALGEWVFEPEARAYRLDEKEGLEARAKAKEAELDQLVGPEIRAKLREEKRQGLTKEQQAALDVAVEKRTPEQKNLALDAEYQLEVDPMLVAAAAPTDKRAAAQRIAADAKAAADRARWIDGERAVLNYDYWKVKCQAELTDDAIEARRLMYLALQQQAASSLADSTKTLFERAFAAYRKVLDKFPAMFENTTPSDDLLDAIDKYRKFLADRGEELPKDFILYDLWQKYEGKR